MKNKAWMLAVSLAALSSLPISAGVFYSPVFNMPLQPAPSPCNGGFYWVSPDCRVFGPNFCLYPPFTPMSGFDSTLVGQAIFAKLFDQACNGSPSKQGGPPGHGSSGSPPPTKQVGVSGYNLDYSDPDCWKKFDATTPMPNGYVPFAPSPQSQPGYGNGPMPMPRYANYPNFQAAAGGYGYGPAAMNWPAPNPACIGRPTDMALTAPMGKAPSCRCKRKQLRHIHLLRTWLAPRECPCAPFPCP